jgi:hypothetical protein
VSEVTSVNGKAGAVVLAAADLEAVPESAVGQPGGVATLNGSGTLTEAQLPSSVVSSRPKSLESVSGLKHVNLAEGTPSYTTIPLELSGATEIEPYNAPANGSPVQLIVNSGTGFAFSLKGVSWIGAEPTEFASGVAGKEYLITIIPVEGKLLAILGKGEKGAPGVEGEKGARGEVGPSSSQAMTRTSTGYENIGNRTVSTFVPTQYTVYFRMEVVPVKCKKLKIYEGFGVVSGHVRAFVFDIGVAKASDYSCVAVSELYEPKTKEKQELIATLERKDGKEWEAGEVVMVGIGADNTTLTFASSTPLLKGAYAEYPGGEIVGTSGVTTATIISAHSYSEGAFKEASPKELGEGSIFGNTTVVLAHTCRWV